MCVYQKFKISNANYESFCTTQHQLQQQQQQKVKIELYIVREKCSVQYILIAVMFSFSFWLCIYVRSLMFLIVCYLIRSGPYHAKNAFSFCSRFPLLLSLSLFALFSSTSSAFSPSCDFISSCLLFVLSTIYPLFVFRSSSFILFSYSSFAYGFAAAVVVGAVAAINVGSTNMSEV